jgi:CRISPR/Cas system-associated endonuclease Cas1
MFAPHAADSPGQTASSDVRLRRAQALATSSGAALRIARELIDKKLAGQERVARSRLLATENADAILCYRSELAEANTIESVRLIESQAASAYWAAWRTLPINFPRKDECRATGVSLGQGFATNRVASRGGESTQRHAQLPLQPA